MTSHIEACRTAWFNHLMNCRNVPVCNPSFPKCEQGKSFYDEYIHAIIANHNCEELEGTSCTTQTK